MKLSNTKAFKIPDNASTLKICCLSDYFNYRRRLQQLTKFYRKVKMNLPDEQGLPNVRRELLQGTH